MESGFFSSKFAVIIRIGFKLTVLNSNFLGKDDAESMVSAVFSVSTLCGKKTNNPVDNLTSFN